MLTKIRLGNNEDGTPQYHYASDKPIVLTGPISGTVTIPDGKTDVTYDVSEAVIEVASIKHAGLVSHAIGMRHEAEGHPLHRPTAADPDPEPFVHVCSSQHCGALVRSADDAVAAYEARVDTSRPDHAMRVAHIRAAHALHSQEG